MTKSEKHCGKRRNCSFWAISSFVTMFSNSRLLQRRQKASIWGKGLNRQVLVYTPQSSCYFDVVCCRFFLCGFITIVTFIVRHYWIIRADHPLVGWDDSCCQGDAEDWDESTFVDRGSHHFKVQSHMSHMSQRTKLFPTISLLWLDLHLCCEYSKKIEKILLSTYNIGF